MRPLALNFTINATGDPDALTLPSDLPPGFYEIVLTPPAGHAWNFYGVTTAGVSSATQGVQSATPRHLAVDESIRLPRCWRRKSETIGFGELDTGSGTVEGVAS